MSFILKNLQSISSIAKAKLEEKGITAVFNLDSLQDNPIISTTSVLEQPISAPNISNESKSHLTLQNNSSEIDPLPSPPQPTVPTIKVHTDIIWDEENAEWKEVITHQYGDQDGEDESVKNESKHSGAMNLTYKETQHKEVKSSSDAYHIQTNSIPLPTATRENNISVAKNSNNPVISASSLPSVPVSTTSVDTINSSLFDASNTLSSMISSAVRSIRPSSENTHLSVKKNNIPSTSISPDIENQFFDAWSDMTVNNKREEKYSDEFNVPIVSSSDLLGENSSFISINNTNGYNKKNGTHNEFKETQNKSSIPNQSSNWINLSKFNFILGNRESKTRPVIIKKAELGRSNRGFLYVVIFIIIFMILYILLQSSFFSVAEQSTLEVVQEGSSTP